MTIERLAVVGLGLIGGSVAKAARAARAARNIVGFDLDPQQNQQALDLGVVDTIGASVGHCVRAADFVVLAVPVLHTAQAMAALKPMLPPGAVVTDVGSTKQSVLRDVAAACGGAVPDWFVPGHPIAGTEKSGVANASAELFRGHRVILTPQQNCSPVARQKVEQLWQSFGARVVAMDAARHDSIFAATSHLPHVLAYSFVDLLARLEGAGEIFPNAGGGFRDFTRIASSSPQMWHDIVKANAGPVSALLERQIGELQEILAMMKAQRWDELKGLFARAREARERHLGQIE